MIRKVLALLLVVATVLSLCSCSLVDMFRKEEEESTTEWTMAPTTEPDTAWMTQEETTEDVTADVSEPHDCLTMGHLWKAATCYAPKTCTVCGETEGTKLTHSFKAATCTSPERCKYCGMTKGSALGHNWGSDGKCTRCGRSKTASTTKNVGTHEHVWADATCDKPRTCTICGATSGSPNKHNYAAATCLKPETCRNCGATKGTALGHNYGSDGYCTRCHLNALGQKDPKYNNTTTSTTKQDSSTSTTESSSTSTTTESSTSTTTESSTSTTTETSTSTTTSTTQAEIIARPGSNG